MAALFNFPVIILLAVFILIAVRNFGKFRLKIWQIMLFGGAAVLVTGQISPWDALLAVDFDVMLFLFGMFVVGEALYESGYLFHLAHRFFRKAKSVDHLVLLILIIFGVFSAFLMNDTLAIIGTPLVINFARKFEISPKLLLLSLAFAVTTGSVMSPIGNPQNLLIAINGNIENPFVTFFAHLFIPTIINLLVAFLFLRLFYGSQFRTAPLNHEDEEIKDPKLAFACKISLFLILFLITAKVALVFLDADLDLRLTYIALIAALPVVLISNKRVRVLRGIDWHTLIFFAAMFVLMESVWQTGFFQSIIAGSNADLSSVPIVLATGVSLSQLISNVPFVALFLPLMTQAGATTAGMMALAAGSTIAGNLLILGAASNVIIIQNAEKKGETLTFFEFAKVGVPLTFVNVIVYWVFLGLIG
ncbi:MAG: anion transporter [Methanomassiliicoccales archaeon]|nr:anion transporter [Methanomassiliicoccales archaeon]